MTDYVGWLTDDGTVTNVTDGNGCYDSNGKCYCADCYHYGSDSVNCMAAGQFDGAKPVKWNGDRWVLATD